LEERTENQREEGQGEEKRGKSRGGDMRKEIRRDTSQSFWEHHPTVIPFFISLRVASLTLKNP